MRAPDFWSRKDFSARAMSAALMPLGWVYGASVRFKRDHTASYRAKAKVVCVGNLTAGGSGKTPVAIAVARQLLARRKRVVFLTRGYGGHQRGPLCVEPGRHTARDVGDEPLLLAQTAPTIVSRDRKAGAILADAQGAEIIVMDDGHQNSSLMKDLSIVVVDAEAGFGNGFVLPAGPLREPVRQGLACTDWVVLIGGGEPDLAGFDGPKLRACLSPMLPSPSVDRVVAFAGIGRPEKFFATLRGLGATIVESHAFADHHPYTYEEITELKAKALIASATLMTTEKDFVRLSEQDKTGVRNLPVRATFATPKELETLLDRVAQPVLAPA